MTELTLLGAILLGAKLAAAFVGFAIGLAALLQLFALVGGFLEGVAEELLKAIEDNGKGG